MHASTSNDAVNRSIVADAKLLIPLACAAKRRALRCSLKQALLRPWAEALAGFWRRYLPGSWRGGFQWPGSFQVNREWDYPRADEHRRLERHENAALSVRCYAKVVLDHQQSQTSMTKRQLSRHDFQSAPMFRVRRPRVYGRSDDAWLFKVHDPAARYGRKWGEAALGAL
jgi:hypothetical protein